MSIFTLALLAIVQGITEFLPISSSAHLVLLHEATGVSPDALALDVAVHLGSVLAVILYFRTDAFRAFKGLVEVTQLRVETDRGFLALCLIVATIPAVVVGAVLALTGWVDLLRDIRVIGTTMIVFGIYLYWAHRTSPETRDAGKFGMRDAVRLGLWQAVALVPGVSRSGITMTAARLAGFERHSAAKLSMLMSIPITLASGGLLGLKAAREGVSTGFMLDAGIAAVLAFLAAYGALALMMRWLGRVSFTPYVIYRVVLGVALLVLAFAGGSA